MLSTLGRSNAPLLLLPLLTVLLSSSANAFVVRQVGRSAPSVLEQAQRRQCSHVVGLAASTQEQTDLQESIASNLEILKGAAETKREDSDVVFGALSDLEKQMRAAAKADPSVAEKMLVSLDGDWRLVFTTGTKNTQDRFGGRINYFPLKAVQSFRTIDEDPMLIENGIYVGDFAVIKFRGTMRFDLKKRKLEFDFDHVNLLQFFDVALGKGEAAKLGSQSGLGSEGNVQLSEKGRSAFFNWISADDDIATARGGGGGLALWKRVK